MSQSYIPPERGYDAVFLPASLRGDRDSLHGCESELYIIYYLDIDEADRKRFEIEVLDKAAVLELCAFAADDHEAFFEYLPDYCGYKWGCYYEGTTGFDEMYSLYNDADFIISRDGTERNEYEFIRRWALNSLNTIKQR